MKEPKLFQDHDETNFHSFASQSETCLYVPAYQRYYVWENKNIRTFLEDLAVGIKVICDNKDAITFIGTLTCFEDDNPSIRSRVNAQLPPHVITVVDGQQRLTTLMICAVILHEFLVQNDYPYVPDRLKQAIRTCRSRLEETIKFNLDTSIDAYFYPKMIRALDDTWTVVGDDYNSPLARLIYSYCIQNSRKYEYGLPEEHNFTAEQRVAHEIFSKRYRSARKNLHKMINGKTSRDTALALPKVEDIVESEYAQSLMFGTHTISREDLAIDKTERLIRALLLAFYLLRRVKFISLISDMEDKAFEIFETLNTRGEQLTSFEAFIPDVIQDSGVDNYQDSEEKKCIDAIIQYINSHG